MFWNKLKSWLANFVSTGGDYIRMGSKKYKKDYTYGEDSGYFVFKNGKAYATPEGMDPEQFDEFLDSIPNEEDTNE